MKRVSTLMTLLALCVACSQSEVVEQAGSKQRLLFSGSASNIVRTVGYNNTDLPSQISVYGFHTKDGQTLEYFDDIAYLMQDRNTYRTNEEHYWTNGVLSFFSFAFEDLNCITADIKTTNHALQFSNPNPLVDSSVEQSDLIYAVNTDCTQEKYGITGVPVFFKHALSQIAFNAAVRNPTIQVEIQSVQLKGLYKEATLTLPEATTSASDEQVAVWSDWKTSQDWCGFDGSVTPAQIAFSASGTTLLSSDLRMIPQKDDQVTLSVNCKVTAANDAQIGIFEGERTYDITIDWQPGVRYTYNLIFDKIGEEIFFVIEIEEYKDEPFKMYYTATERVEPNNETHAVHQPHKDRVVPFGGGATYLPEKSHFDATTGQGYWAFDKVPTSIGCCAFRECDALLSVYIPEGVTKLEYRAFRDCDNLSAVYLPEGMTTFVGDAFQNCPNLTHIVLPSTMTSLGTYSFASCKSLRSIVIPEKITSLGTALFADCSSLTKVTFPENLTFIGHTVFSGCTSLKSIQIPAKVTSMDGNIFLGCTGLTSVELPEGLTKLGYNDFDGCTSLKHIDLPSTLTTMEKGVFRGCTALTSLEIPDGVTTFSAQMCEGCTNLTAVTLSPQTTTIGAKAFYNCSSLPAITLPETLTAIGDDAFYGCLVLKEISIPESVTTFGRRPFSLCPNLSSLSGKFATADHRALIADGVMVAYADQGENGYVVPDGVTFIEDALFYERANLTSVTLPAGLTTIGVSAFAYCSGLLSITFPEGIETIDTSAFSRCTGLLSVTFPEGLTAIGYSAFSGCQSLPSVTIPSTITTLNDYTFYNCSALAEVIVLPTTPPKVGSNYVLRATAATMKVYVPAESVDAYKQAVGWNYHASRIRAIE